MCLPKFNSSIYGLIIAIIGIITASVACAGLWFVRDQSISPTVIVVFCMVVAGVAMTELLNGLILIQMGKIQNQIKNLENKKE